MAPKRNAALGFIFITLLIDVTGLGIIIPVFPNLIKELTGGTLGQASMDSGWLMLAYSVTQFLFAPFLGCLSDHYGRRPILLLSLFGLGVDYLFLSFAPTLGWLYLGRIIAGFCGASFTTATAYIADVSEPEKKAQNFGLIGVAFGVGFIIGPVIGGIFGQLGTRVPFMISAGFSLINCIYGYFILPESLAVDLRRPFTLKRANPAGALAHLRKYPMIIGLVLSIFFLYLAGQAIQSVWTFFTMQQFGWNTALVGLSLGFVGMMIALVQGGLIRLTIPRLGQKNSLYIGLVLNAIGLLLFSFATKGWMMFVFLIPYTLGGIAGPSLMGIISNQVPDNEQGELQGALTSVFSITAIIGPPLMTSLFDRFTSASAVRYFPGAPFLMGAILIGISMLFSIRALSHQKLGATPKIM